MKILFDAHTHVNEEEYTDDERKALAQAIEASDVRYVVDAGSDPASCRQALKDVHDYDWCYAAVGIHPHEVRDMSEQTIDELREFAKDPKVRAIGEIGLDFYYDLSPRDAQRTWFRRQIRLANELKMPIVIHSRDAEQETMNILKEEGAFSEERKAFFPKRPGPDGERDDARVLIHCFSGSAETARQYVGLGATISICGPVTFRNNRKTKEVVRTTPIEFLTIETDAPYLTPEPFRGRPNRSPYVEYTCRAVAELKGLTYEQTADITCRNAMRFYGIEEI